MLAQNWAVSSRIAASEKPHGKPPVQAYINLSVLPFIADLAPTLPAAAFGWPGPWLDTSGEGLELSRGRVATPASTIVFVLEILPTGLRFAHSCVCMSGFAILMAPCLRTALIYFNKCVVERMHFWLHGPPCKFEFPKSDTCQLRGSLLELIV